MINVEPYAAHCQMNGTTIQKNTFAKRGCDFSRMFLTKCQRKYTLTSARRRYTPCRLDEWQQQTNITRSVLTQTTASAGYVGRFVNTHNPTGVYFLGELALGYGHPADGQYKPKGHWEEL